MLESLSLRICKFFFQCFPVLTYILDSVLFMKKLKTTASYWKIAHSGDCPYPSAVEMNLMSYV